MPWCPTCGTEYDPGILVCADCNTELVDTPPVEETDEDPVVVLEAHSVVEAQIAEATLEAEGIPAYVQSPVSLSPNVGVMGVDTPELDVVVAAEDAEDAAAVLHEVPLSDEELTTMEENVPGAGNAS